MMGQRPSTRMCGLKTLLLSVIVVLSGITGCSESLSPETADVTGHWTLEFVMAPTDFTLDLVEAPDGTIQGTWSFPSSFAYHQVRGRREGLEVSLSADSPNIYPVLISARFVGRNRMEGQQYFAGTIENVVLWRGRASER